MNAGDGNSWYVARTHPHAEAKRKRTSSARDLQFICPAI